MTLEKYPWYRPRSRGGMISAIAAWDTDRSPPPPIPCRMRAPISCGIVCDSAHNTEAPTNSAMPINRIGLRP